MQMYLQKVYTISTNSQCVTLDTTATNSIAGRDAYSAVAKSYCDGREFIGRWYGIYHASCGINIVS